MNHTPRTELVYRLAREVGRFGSPVSKGKLGHDIWIYGSTNLVTTLNRSTGDVRVRDRWSGELLFEGSHKGWTRCAATTKDNGHQGIVAHLSADIDLDDSIPWQRELRDVLRSEKGMEVAA